MNRKLDILLWSLSFAALAVTVWILARSGIGTEAIHAHETPAPSSEDVAARVGDCILTHSDVALLRLGEGAVDAWVEDQILASAATEMGLENPAISGFIEQRARQLYLRDLMLNELYARVSPPSHDETWALMRLEPELFLIERHYHHIIAADSMLADSLHTRLALGQSFDIIAGNISLGQKAGIGGDLGHATGAQMLIQGFPPEVALLNGLGDVVKSSLGWHVFMVTGTRALEDSVRAHESASRLLYDRRVEAALDSLIQVTGERLSTEVHYR